MAGNTIAVTVTQRDGIHTTGTPDMISSAQVISVRDLGGTQREIILNKPKGPASTELIVSDTYSALKTALNSDDVTFKDVTVVTINEIHEVDSVNYLLNDSRIIKATEVTLRASFGTGSRIEYDEGVKDSSGRAAKPTYFDVLESPAAIIAGNVSA